MLDAYFEQRAFELSPNGQQIVNLSADHFFRLGSVVEWAGEIRDRTRAQAAKLDDALSSQLKKLRSEYDRDPCSLDQLLPAIPFRVPLRATFAWTHLLRNLVLEAKAYQFKRNDGLDFCHAVIAAAYGAIATLDKQWIRRVNNLPKPNEAALVFYRPEIDEFVEHFEAIVAKVNASNESAV